MSFDAETHPHHAQKTGHGWVDMVVAFSALFVSVVSLGVAVHLGRTMENMAEANARLVSANSWPFLFATVGTGLVDGEQKIHMGVINQGVGPAKIESAELIWKGVAYRSDGDFMKACCNGDLEVHQYDSDLVMNAVMRAGDKILYLELKHSADSTLYAKLEQAMYSPDFKLVICYCSIFDECWKTDITTFNLSPPRVKSCQRPKVPFDEGLLDRKT